MSEIQLAATALVVVLFLLLVLMGWTGRIGRSRAGVRSEPHHVWAVARANTSDGVTARLEVEVLVQVEDSTLDRATADAELVDAIEETLRHRITGHPVAALPSVGDDAPFLDENVIPGFRLLRGAVTLCDVEVTPELRRLVTDRSAP